MISLIIHLMFYNSGISTYLSCQKWPILPDN